jgi:hypothetical protein
MPQDSPTQNPKLDQYYGVRIYTQDHIGDRRWSVHGSSSCGEDKPPHNLNRALAASMEIDPCYIVRVINSQGSVICGFLCLISCHRGWIILLYHLQKARSR